jgi:ABC-type transport system involved in cytochrome c biogenesis permease subunit
MIVGSYGVLLLAGVLGHLLLIYGDKASKGLFPALLLSLYIGVALLIPGTLLGGVWAAQSWGRFWDWDPKESWAFITACIYLLFIHAYRFKYIGPYGLAFGSIFGLIAVSFTWYGVNYILGTGLHSYGFGNGGEWIYYLFIVAELTFLLVYSLLFKREIGINFIHSKNREEI